MLGRRRRERPTGFCGWWLPPSGFWEAIAEDDTKAAVMAQMLASGRQGGLKVLPAGVEPDENTKPDVQVGIMEMAMR